jgi:hypothetical protein
MPDGERAILSALALVTWLGATRWAALAPLSAAVCSSPADWLVQKQGAGRLEERRQQVRQQEEAEEEQDEMQGLPVLCMHRLHPVLSLSLSPSSIDPARCRDWDPWGRSREERGRRREVGRAWVEEREDGEWADTRREATGD